MNVKEFKWHIRNGLIRPDYFKIPYIEKSDTSVIAFRFVYDDGDDLPLTEIRFSYRADQLSHDSSTSDLYYKGYAFNSDTEWRFPVPDPSEYEIYPLPDFNDIYVSGGTITINTETGSNFAPVQFTVVMDEPSALFEIHGLPPGMYLLDNPKDLSYLIPIPSDVISISYYPDMYNDYDAGHPVRHDSALMCMIDRNMRFSGFVQKYVWDANDNFVGYDFYCLTDKFSNNIMRLVAQRRPSVRWEIYLGNLPGYTGESFVSELGSGQVYYSLGAYALKRGVAKSKMIYHGKQVAFADIYVNNRYKGTVMLGNIEIRKENYPVDVYEIVGSHEQYNVQELDIERSDGAYGYSIIYNGLCMNKEQVTDYSGSQYLDFTAEDLENVTYHTSRNGILEWADDCNDSGTGSVGYTHTYTETETCTLTGTVRKYQYRTIKRIYAGARMQGQNTTDGYTVNRTKVGGLTNVTLGSYITETSDSYDYESEDSYTLSYMYDSFDMWNGSMPSVDDMSPGEDRYYYYLTGMTIAEYNDYVDRFMEETTTVVIK